MGFISKHVFTQTLNKQPSFCFKRISVYVSYSNGLEGNWIVSIGVKEKPSTWEGNILSY